MNGDRTPLEHTFDTRTLSYCFATHLVRRAHDEKEVPDEADGMDIDTGRGSAFPDLSAAKTISGANHM
jgi:hypothetical protein